MWDATGQERWHMQIDRLDHLVLTVADIERSCEFYRRILGFEPITFADNRKPLVFGRQKNQPASPGPGIRTQGTASYRPVPQTYAL
jgi:catechol 2,3-dioxygenase-like lactoylglutathione lyase family enzyme